jgi:hypothetical protein
MLLDCAHPLDEVVDLFGEARNVFYSGLQSVKPDSNVFHLRAEIGEALAHFSPKGTETLKHFSSKFGSACLGLRTKSFDVFFRRHFREDQIESLDDCNCPPLSQGSPHSGGFVEPSAG